MITETTTWLPIAPPTVRMLAFIPVATPVWVPGTACTIRFVIAENASPMPRPASASAKYTCHSALCATARNANAKPPISPPATSGIFDPTAAVIGPMASPTRIIAMVAGSIASPAAVTDAPKP